jgi:hypothetical protein
MAGRPRYTADQVARALKATRGLVSLAAQHLGCDPDTVQGYCRRHATVEAAKRQARDSILDVAEARLFLAVDRGEAWAITFYLKTIRRMAMANGWMCRCPSSAPPAWSPPSLASAWMRS